MRCPDCGHDEWGAETGTCLVTAVNGVPVREDGESCGCTTLGTNGTCVECGRAFLCPTGHDAHPAHDCHSCANRKFYRETEERFWPLSEPLSRLLEFDVEVTNTGGGIMCLQVNLPRGFYAWFSEFDRIGEDDPESLSGFGLYYFRDGGGDDWSDGGGTRWFYEGCPRYDPEHGQAVAEWAAPLLLRIAEEVERGVTIRDVSVGEWHDV